MNFFIIAIGLATAVAFLLIYKSFRAILDLLKFYRVRITRLEGRVEMLEHRFNRALAERGRQEDQYDG